MSDDEKWDDAEYGLQVSFAGAMAPADEAAFVNGFEVGAICQRIMTESEFECPIHTANLEVLARCCKGMGFYMQSRPTMFEEWRDGWFSKNPPKRAGFVLVQP